MGKTLKTKKVNEKYWYQYLVLLPLYFILRIWQATIRLDISDKDKNILLNTPSPHVVLFWHTYLFSSIMIQRRWRKNRPLRPLISASKDGAWLDAIFRIVGLRSIRGSANFRGAQSLKEMIKVVRRGEDIGITPDGSNGPAYKLKVGTAAVAKVCKCPMIMFSAEHSSAWRLNSWDKFYLPKPFSSIKITVDKIDHYEDLNATDPHDASEVLEKRLMALQKPDPLISSKYDL